MTQNNDSKPKVSVIMPSLNVREYIRECIESVIEQTLPNIEIICVDAGSTDGTLQVLEEYQKKDNRIKIIISDKKSYGYQMNLGISAASGEYIGIVETDDYIDINMYKTLYNAAVLYDAEIVKSDYKRFVGTGENKKFEYRRLISFDNKLYNKVLSPYNDPQCLKIYLLNTVGIFKKSFLTSHNIYFNETPGAAYQDNGFWFKTFCLAKSLVVLPTAFYFNRRDNDNSSINSKAKVYCICEEYDHIREWIKEHPTIEITFAKWCAYFRFTNYEWTLERIDNIYKGGFLCKYSEDFKGLYESNELDKELFTHAQWKKLMQIIETPNEYFNKYIFASRILNTSILSKSDDNTKELQALLIQLQLAKEEILNIHSSWSYRIGRVITFVPRKIRSGIRCYRENGIQYTLRRVKEKFLGLLGK